VQFQAAFAWRLAVQVLVNETGRERSPDAGPSDIKYSLLHPGFHASVAGLRSGYLRGGEGPTENLETMQNANQ